MFAAMASLFSVVQQTPVFRTGVDLVVIDVVVVNKAGNPVTDLKASDFTVVAARRPRRIVAADFVRTAPHPAVATTESALAAVSAPSVGSDGSRPLGRTFLFVVDVDEIRAGQGGVAIKSIAEYVDRLPRDDRVGIVALPTGTPHVDPTTNRDLIRSAAGRIFGTANRYGGLGVCEMTPGEAHAIVSNDDRGWKAYQERTAGRPCPQQDPRRTLERYTRHTRAILDTLEALAETIAPLPGSKTLVYVSEGIVANLDTTLDVRDFARITEKTGVTLYSLHLDVPPSEASLYGNNSMLSRRLDDLLGMDSMVEISHAARGTAFRVSGSAINALTQIDRETSGYYLLSFEREPTDKDGARVGVQIRVNRPGLDVRARREFTAASQKATPKIDVPQNPKEVIAELLKLSTPVVELGVDIDTFFQPVRGSATGVQIMLVAEINHRGRPISAVGYEIFDEQDKRAAESFDYPPILKFIDDTRTLYQITQPLAAGKYRLKLGVIDEDGRRGSIEHRFEVPSWTPNALRMSDLIVGDASKGFRPAARIGGTSGRLGVRVELHVDSSTLWEGASLELVVERTGSSSTVERRTLDLASTNDTRVRNANTVVDLAGYSPGEYVISAILRGPNGEVARRSRTFKR